MVDDIHTRRTAKQARDPVCGMVIGVEEAVGKIDHGEHVHYFCSQKCQREFEKNPKKYH
jgi:P-type Cu+ transporter